MKKFRLKKEKRCMDCDGDITLYHGLCTRCKDCQKEFSTKYKRNWYVFNKKVTKPHNCKSCGVAVYWGSLRCKSCSTAFLINIRGECMDCGANVNSQAKRCKNCKKIKVAEYGKKWYQKNKAKAKLQSATWAKENKIKIQKTRELWRKKNKKRLEKKRKEWYKNNPDKIQAARKRRVESGLAREYWKKQVDNLTDLYIRSLLRDSMNGYSTKNKGSKFYTAYSRKKMANKDVPQSLVEIKRKELLLKRALKKIKKERE